jgi:hypothetical protein
VKERVQRGDGCGVVLVRASWFISTKGVAYQIDRENRAWCRDEPSWPERVGEVFYLGEPSEPDERTD